MHVLISALIKNHGNSIDMNRNGEVIVSVLSYNAVDCGFETRLGKTKDYKIGICCFSAKHAALRRKSKDRLACNQDNVYVYPWTVVSVS